MSSFIDRYFPYKTFSRPARLYLLSVMISGIIFSAWQLFFNLFILARGYDKVFLGLINAAPWIAGLFFSLPLGALSNRMGRKNAMVAGMGVDFAMRALQVVVQSPELLVIVSFLEGIGFTLLIVSEAPFLMAASDDKNRSLLFSLNFGLLTLSSAVGAVFAGQMPSLVAGRMNVSPESSTAYGAVLLFSLLIGVFSFWPLLRIDESEIHDSKTREQKSSILSALKETPGLETFSAQSHSGLWGSHPYPLYERFLYREIPAFFRSAGSVICHILPAHRHRFHPRTGIGAMDAEQDQGSRHGSGSQPGIPGVDRFFPSKLGG